MNYQNIPPPDNFDELADWLLTVDSQFSPSELHGAFIGGLSGCMRLPPSQWAQFGLAVMGASQHVIGHFSDLAEATLGGMARQQLEVLASEDLIFQPFLPDDDEPIEQRTEGLSSWCKGFLGGFAESQVFLQKSQPESDSPEGRSLAGISLPENVQEALQDLSAIAQAIVEDMDGDYDEGSDDDFEDGFVGEPLDVDGVLTEDGEEYEADAHDAEAAERDYMEIVEYLRLAAITVFTEYGWIEMLEQNLVSDRPDQGSPAAVSKLFQPGNKTMH